MSAAGRGIGILLMIGGITLFGLLTANIAAFLVAEEEEEDEKVVLERLQSLLDRMEALRSGWRAWLTDEARRGRRIVAVEGDGPKRPPRASPARISRPP